MNSRYLGAVILAPLLLFIFLGGLPLKIFIFILSIIGLYEFYNALKAKEIKPFSIIGYISLLIFFLTKNNFEMLIYIIVFSAVVSLLIPVFDLNKNFNDSSLTILGFIYVAVLFSFIPLINEMKYGNYLVWLVFIGSWLCDTLAYYCGRYLGKKKLCPKVSPKKTIAGAVGGFFGSLIACTVFGIIINNYGVDIQIIHFVIIGALCGIMGQLGDLVASSIKRQVGIKDYGNLIPGHGGVLDRFDSILFNAIVVFYYLTFILGL